MPRVVILIGSCVLFATTLTACTSNPSSPEEAATCGDLVDLAVTAVVDARDSAANLTVQDFQLPDGDAQTIVTKLMESGDAISARSSDLGCDSAEWDIEYRERILKLVPLTEGGLYVLQVALSPIVTPF